MPIRLPVGSYWVWGTDADQVGNPAAWRNPGGGFGNGCEEFGLMTDCADRSGSDVTNPDLSFRLEGRRASGVFKVVAAKALKGGKLSLTVNAPNLGRLKVSGTAVKPAGITVTKLGKVRVGLKPTAAAKRKLANGRRPKANLTLTLPPYFDGTKLKARFQKTLKP